MILWQQRLTLSARSRGYHVITDEVVKACEEWPEHGLLHIFLQHTSAALCVNEAADPDVLTDFESMINHIVPERLPFLTHTIEGDDDMPAHIKAALIGTELSIPTDAQGLMLGRWQGIYLCEFRNHARARSMILTMHS